MSKRTAPIRITTAPQSRQDEMAGRQRKYAISMTIRTLCFIGCVVAAYNHVTWLWITLLAASLFLPYVAVVMANAVNSKGEDFTLDDSPYGRPELRGGRPPR
ncbi:DUF3099 domain-containing protein [Nocardioides baekrokdamisoli]|nr:DUF3099 domain-containing protein [Nocardioides baekrokdamisoli]